MHNRRQFLKSALTSTAVLALNQTIFAKPNEEQLTILHTNDVHSRVEPFPLTDAKYPGMGGVAMRSQLINEFRKNKEHVLLVDAGDIFQGTPYFNFFKGSVEIDLMNQMGYEASTIGNHEFDGGMENLALQISRANFPFVNCNYDFSQSLLNGKIHKHITLKKGNLKIGITGCGVELNGLVPDKLCEGIIYHSPIEKIQEQVDILKQKEHCDIVVVLSHLGYEYSTNKVSDIVLAKQTKHIDFIIGGHTHTFLKEPSVVKDLSGKDVVINQVGWSGIYLGQLDLFFEKKSTKKRVKHHTVIIN